jgi:hypothetical protein
MKEQNQINGERIVLSKAKKERKEGRTGGH